MLAVVAILVMASPMWRGELPKQPNDAPDITMTQSGPSPALTLRATGNVDALVLDNRTEVSDQADPLSPTAAVAVPSVGPTRSAPVALSSSPRSNAIAPLTPRSTPAARPAASPVASATRRAPPRPTPSRSQLERRLLRLASRWDCQRFRGRDNYDPFEYDAQAAITCGEPARGITELALFSFPDDESLANYFQYRVANVGELLAWDGACVNGASGVREWEHGSVACWIASTGSKAARIRWTDERNRTYGVLDGSDMNLARLFRWWTANIR
jgi:hypothetical protein